MHRERNKIKKRRNTKTHGRIILNRSKIKGGVRNNMLDIIKHHRLSHEAKLELVATDVMLVVTFCKAIRRRAPCQETAKEDKITGVLASCKGRRSQELYTLCVRGDRLATSMNRHHDVMENLRCGSTAKAAILERRQWHTTVPDGRLPRKCKESYP